MSIFDMFVWFYCVPTLVMGAFFIKEDIRTGKVLRESMAESRKLRKDILQMVRHE